MSKYKVGDKVRIKIFGEYSYPKHWVSYMLKYCGAIVTIKKVGVSDDYYRINEYDYSWEDGDFESIVEMNMFEIEEFKI